MAYLAYIRTVQIIILINVSPHFRKHADKKKKSVKGTPTQLKIEKAVEGNLAKLRLDEENTTTSTPKPEEKNTNWAVIAEKPFQFPFRHPCELCNVFGHWHHFCPYLECIPDNVTQVPKGYEICYERGVRYAEMINCVLCGKFGDHVSKNCPERSKFMAIIDSVIGISRPTPSSC